MPAAPPVLTIGHSNHPWKRFVALLAGAGVTALADVRSSPHSRHAPQFCKDRLAASLKAAGIAYVFLGRELGGRPADPALLTEGVADYEKMARQPSFAHGLARLIAGAARHRIALMCAEQDPLDCHRCLLVARRLAERGVSVGHILADGRIESQAEAEDRLLAATRRAGEDLFASRAERLALAYREQARRAAFREEQPGGGVT